jgi:hypothetical protein
MHIFGIRISEFGESDEHYVSDSAVLSDWLLANNYEPSDRDSQYLVKAPEGYTFYKGSLVSNDSPELDDKADVSDYAYVAIGSPENDKALMLLDRAMRHVEPADFYALGIDEDDILDYMAY